MFDTQRKYYCEWKKVNGKNQNDFSLAINLSLNTQS